MKQTTLFEGEVFENIANPDEENSGLRTVLSYGGGVQTFAMLLFIEAGIMPKPDCLIFADTGCEWPHTYKHIEQVAKPICVELGIPFYTVQHGTGLIDGYAEASAIPMAGFRSCTVNYKIRPINDFIKKTWPDEKKNGKASFISLIGISTDEAQRAVKREEQAPKWIYLKYPLLEANLSRLDCINMIENSKYIASKKSGCYLCPYSKLQEWAKLKRQHPELLQNAVELEEKMRAKRPEREIGLLGNDRMMWLSEFAAMHTLEDFGAVIEPGRECDSGGCFL